MSNIFRFPIQAVLMMPADGCWLVTVGAHGWLHGSSIPALDDAQWLSRNYGLPVRLVGVST
jgi:hypothetical protein